MREKDKRLQQDQENGIPNIDSVNPLMLSGAGPNLIGGLQGGGGIAEE